MTMLAFLDGTITVTDDGSATLLADVETTDAEPFEFTLTVDDRAAVAFAQRFQRVGAQLTVDGQIVPDREIGNVLAISEGTDRYGDRLQIQLVGEKYSPFARGLIRSKAPVLVDLKIGSPTQAFDGRVFDGHFVAAEYEISPPAANITCLDAAALYAAKTAPDYAVPPNSGKSRLQVGLEICAIAGIPVGSIALPYGHGGIISKPVTPGDQPVLDFLRDFWGAVGVKIGFESGRLTAHVYDPNAPAVMVIHAGNLIASGSTITAPDTLAPNVVGVVSVSFTRKEIGGRTTTETRVVVVAPYGPMSEAGQTAVENRVVSEVITRVTMLGTLDELTEEYEFGWYSPLAAATQIEPDAGPAGYVITDYGSTYGGTSYTYPDGSTHDWPIERFIEVRRRIVRKTVDADYNVVGIREEKYFWHFLQKAIWKVVAGVDELQTATRIPLSDDGLGLLHATEVIGFPAVAGNDRFLGRPDELIVTDIELNADGTIREETETAKTYTIGPPVLRADDAYGYGVDNVSYTAQDDELSGDAGNQWTGLRVTRRRYRAVDEDRHDEVETVTGVNGRFVEQKTTRVSGALPRPERAQPTSTSQEIRQEVEDLERIALAGEEIGEVVHNEYIETSEEAAALARYLAREAAALRLRGATVLEPLAHKFAMVEIDLPGSSIDGLRFEIESVTRDVADMRQEFVAVRYPDDLT